MADLAKLAREHAAQEAKIAEVRKAEIPGLAIAQARKDFPEWQARIKENIERGFGTYVSVSDHDGELRIRRGWLGMLNAKYVYISRSNISNPEFRNTYVNELQSLLGDPFRVSASGGSSPRGCPGRC